jgi:uncharacterized paraquat-inducible protein A
MLMLASGNCEKCGGGLGPMATIQSVGVTCRECDYQFKVCGQCKKAGCSKCGGMLLDAWESTKYKSGQDVMF